MLMISRDRSKVSGCLLVIGHHTQLQNGLGLELTDPLTRHIDLTTDFGQGQRLSTIQAETQFEDFLLSLVELRKPASQVFFLDAPIHPFHRFRPVGVWNQFAKGAAIFFATRVGIK